MFSFSRKYGKTILAAVATAALAAEEAVTDGTITKAEWVTIVTAVLGTVGVYFGPAVTKASRMVSQGQLPERDHL